MSSLAGLPMPWMSSHRLDDVQPNNTPPTRCLPSLPMRVASRQLPPGASRIDAPAYRPSHGWPLDTGMMRG